VLFAVQAVSRAITRDNFCDGSRGAFIVLAFAMAGKRCNAIPRERKLRGMQHPNQSRENGRNIINITTAPRTRIRIRFRLLPRLLAKIISHGAAGNPDPGVSEISEIRDARPNDRQLDTWPRRDLSMLLFRQANRAEFTLLSLASQAERATCP